MKRVVFYSIGGLLLIGVSVFLYRYTQTSTSMTIPTPTPTSPKESAPVPVDEHVGSDISFSPEDWGSLFLIHLKGGPSFLAAELSLTIPPPPASWSRQTADEIVYLHSLEGKRTKENTKMRNEEYVDFRPGFFTQTGIATTTKSETLQLMAIVSNEVGYFILREKWKYQRARAYRVDPTLTTDVPRPAHPSYPSGHAGQSRAVALLLADLDPAHKDIYIAYGTLVGTNRELGGVHYPSDTAAGVSLANQVMPHLFENVAFRTELEKVRADEWR